MERIKKELSAVLQQAQDFGLGYAELNLLAINAVKNVLKKYSFTGSLTKEDFHSIAWKGIMSAISKQKFIDYTNKSGYVFVFARGYCQHAVHRESRLIRVPSSAVNKTGSAHLSYSWGNLPEPEALAVSEFTLYQKILVSELSNYDQKAVLNNKPLSVKGQQVVNKILCSV